MKLGHPSTRKLQRWIDGDQDSLDRHLATCNYCADRIESLLEDSGANIGPALLTLLDVPQELPEKLQAGIDTRMSGRSDLTLIGELFGLPLRTARLMSSTHPGDDH